MDALSGCRLDGLDHAAGPPPTIPTHGAAVARPAPGMPGARHRHENRSECRPSPWTARWAGWFAVQQAASCMQLLAIREYQAHNRVVTSQLWCFGECHAGACVLREVRGSNSLHTDTARCRVSFVVSTFGSTAVEDRVACCRPGTRACSRYPLMRHRNRERSGLPDGLGNVSLHTPRHMQGRHGIDAINFDQPYSGKHH